MEEVTESANIPTTSEDIGNEVEGMDATETEKEEEAVAEGEEVEELPGELKQLLQRLEEKAESWPEAGQSFKRIVLRVEGKHQRISSWGLFDTADGSYKSFKEWRMLLGAQAKLRLLQAIGSCRTLRSISAFDLTRDELEALLTPLQSNPVLEMLHFNSEDSSADKTENAANVERTCEILGRILHTSRTIKSLRLYLWELTAAGACHLVSGLRGNAESAITTLYIGKWEESIVANQVAEMVLSAPRLQQLGVVRGGVLDNDGIEALANAIAQSTSLEMLELRKMGRGASALLLKALTGERSNKSIVTLSLTGVMEGIGDVLPRLLSSNQSLKEFNWCLIERRNLSQWRSLYQSLGSNSSLELFRIEVNWPSLHGETTNGREDLLNVVYMKNSCVGLYVNSEIPATRNNPFISPSEWRGKEEEKLLLEINMTKPIFELHLFLRDLEEYSAFKDGVRVWTRLTEALSSKVTHLSSLYLQMSPEMLGAKGKEVEDFFRVLQRSSTLRVLTVDGGDGQYWPGGWKELIDCLRVNTSITHLRLIDCKDLDEDVFRQFMGVLQVNLTLKRIRLNGTSWETDGKKALIREALRRNAKQDTYFSIFRRQRFPFHPAKNGRLFLCGSPLAGKTKLLQTMTRILRGNTWLGNKLADLWRTKGVEVQLLRDDEEMQIAVWDLAGQWIFRTLQDILFPRTNHSSIFLFVFSPFDRVNGCIKGDLDQSLKEELEEWLRFIASNSQVTGRMLPRVLVVISHMDKMKDRDVGWGKSIVKELGREFQGILDVCESENLFQVNACKKSEVNPLKDYIFESFKDMLKDKALLAPKVCVQISSRLARRTKDIKCRPIWSSKEFYRFCFQSLQGDVEESMNPEAPEGLEVFKAMASYLHDTGSIITISSLDKIIVDPNWLTNVFLGELITMGHNFQVNSHAVEKSEPVPLSSKTGFVSCSHLQFLLSSFLDKRLEFRGLDRSLLEELLIHFDLCYRLEDEARYYIPAIVCEDINFRGFNNHKRASIGIESLSWSSPMEINQHLESTNTFFGFRVECENPKRMSMTAAFYPRFQIYLRQKLITERNLTVDRVICSRHYMRLHMGGHVILVERSDMTKSHIDVMVKCSQHREREIVVKYIEKHIIDEIRAFCASPKGCPGITLVVGVLQTQCVEKLVPLPYRGDNQAILIRKLKENFGDDIKEHVLEDMKIGPCTRDSSSLLNYEHYWPPIPGYLPGIYQLAKELLSETEVESVTKEVLEKQEWRLKLLDEVSEEITDEVNLIHCAPEVGNLSTATEVRDPSSSSTNTLSPSYTTQPTLGRVLSKIDRLEHTMVGIGHGLQERMDERFDNLENTLKRIENNMGKIIMFQDKLVSSLSSFMSKVDKMIGYAESWEQSRTPKRPYLCFENVSIFQKVIATMRVGKAVRLHLMCESLVGTHIVKDQPGLNLCLEKQNMEWLRCIYDISFKMMYYLVKAGLQVTLGLGQAVPELSSLEAALPLSLASAAIDNITIDVRKISVESSGNMTLDEAWSRLRSVLASKLENNYTGLFKLYRVKYLNLKEGRYAWVCDQCMMRGIRNGSLASL